MKQQTMNNMVEVSREQFYAYVNQRDIIVGNMADYAIWETRNRVEIGRTFPGWKNPRDKQVYMLTEAAYETLKDK